MSHRTPRWMDAAGGRIAVDGATGALTNAILASSNREFVDSPSSSGLLRLAVPLDGYGSHYLELGTHGLPQVSQHGDTVRLTYTELSSAHHAAAIHVEVDLTPSPQGLVLRARVRNDGDLPIPQVAFPQLLGLAAGGQEPDARVALRASPAGHPPRVVLSGSDETRVRLSRATVRHRAYRRFN